jgi:hypothetical protein
MSEIVGPWQSNGPRRAPHADSYRALPNPRGPYKTLPHPGEGSAPQLAGHEAPNLFISDGTVQTSAVAANPTPTVVALVLRQADYIGRAMAAGRILTAGASYG